MADKPKEIKPAREVSLVDAYSVALSISEDPGAAHSSIVNLASAALVAFDMIAALGGALCTRGGKVADPARSAAAGRRLAQLAEMMHLGLSHLDELKAEDAARAEVEKATEAGRLQRAAAAALRKATES